MIVPGSANSLLLAQGASTAYNLTKSLRFRSSASAYLNRTPASVGNQKTYTWSGWIKRGSLAAGSTQIIFGVAGYEFRIISDGGSSGTADSLQFSLASGYGIQTSPVLRDPSSWYHIMLVVDTTQATASNRAKIYLNGNQLTSSGAANLTLNQNTDINNTVSHTIGRRASSSVLYFDGYMTEVNFIDGQALTPSSFGENNTTTGVWQPKAYTGTYGTNGFYLPFTNTTSTSTLGNDSSGNGNNWTTNNFSLTAGSTYDSMTDVPTLTSATTANYPVLNPLGNVFALQNSTMSNGNLTATYASNSWWSATMALPSSGKFYCEYVSASVTNVPWIGVVSQTNSVNAQYTSSGEIRINSSAVTTVASYAAGDIVSVAYDCGAGTVTFYKNNTSVYTGSLPYTAMMFFAGFASTGNTVNVNFGQRPFAYTPPTGYVALNTYNLPTSTIVKGNTVMDATLYTGTGSAQSIVNAAGFKPDLVWVKSRSNAYNNGLIDSVRGVGKYLFSDLTDAETTYAAGFTSFNSNGFSIGDTGTTTNANGATYVGWQWQAGQGTTSSNTNGSITSTVSVNPSAGFSVVTYTGNGSSSATVGHGLGVVPSWIITKHRSDTSNWMVYHTSLSSGNNLRLNTTDSQFALSGTTYGGISTSPTSTTFGFTSGTSGVDNSNANGVTMVAYCWAQIDGFSKFGSYTGNGSADGPFVYTGFRPKYVLYKRSDGGTESWRGLDTTRNPYNLAVYRLSPNENSAEGTSTGFNNLDFLSNGFKVRSNSSDQNTSGATYIYVAFAENPFKNALAR